MDIAASELFWKLIGDKGGIVPDTQKPVYAKECKPKEASWARFKTVTGERKIERCFPTIVINYFLMCCTGMTGTLSSDYLLAPGPSDNDLDEMSEVIIEPSYHKGVLRDPKVLPLQNQIELRAHRLLIRGLYSGGAILE
jgi:hypothetical protein